RGSSCEVQVQSSVVLAGADGYPPHSLRPAHEIEYRSTALAGPPSVRQSQVGPRVGKTGIVPTERIELAVGPDDVRATAIDAVLVPRPGVHERLDEKPERVRFIHFKFLQEFAQWLGFAAAFDQILQTIPD